MYIGKIPSRVPLTSSDLADDIVTADKIADAVSLGKILQQVNASTSTQVALSSGTLTDTGLTASITPSATSSKILVLVSHNGNYKSADDVNNSILIKLYRGTTEIGKSGGVNWTGNAKQTIIGSLSFNVVDSPSSTSAQTYKTQFKNINGGAEVAVQKSFGGDWASTSYITLMEIGA
tara:strand:- start:534 stop:1064 length:531 start_codon:yes stop_codon:yes gene_type:complete